MCSLLSRAPSTNNYKYTWPSRVLGFSQETSASTTAALGATTTLSAAAVTGPPPTINTDSATETALHLNQNQFRQSSVRVGSSNTTSSEHLGYSLAQLTPTTTRARTEDRIRQREQPNINSISSTSKSCELIVLPFTSGQKSPNAAVRVELRRNRSLNEQSAPNATSQGTPHCLSIRAPGQGVSLNSWKGSRQSSIDSHSFSGRPLAATKTDVGTHSTAVDGHPATTTGAVPSITVDGKRTIGAAPGKLPEQSSSNNNTNSAKSLKVFKHKPIISTSFDCAGRYDDPYFHRYDDENERLDDNEEKHLFPVKLEAKAKLQSNSDIILRNHSYKSCVKRKSNHSTGNLDDLFHSLRASGDHQPQFAYYYLDDGLQQTTTSSSSHSTSPSTAAASAIAALATHSSSLHPHSHPLNSFTTAAGTGLVVVGRQTASATSPSSNAGQGKHSLSKSLNCLRKRSAKLKFHLKPLKIAQITTDSDSISISNCQVPITLAQYGNAASSSSLSLSPSGGGGTSVGAAASSPLTVYNGQQLQQQQQHPSYVPSGAASSGSSPNRYSATLPKLGGSLNRPRLNSSDSHKVHAKHKSKPVHHHSHQDPICAGYVTPSGSGTAFELTSTSKSPVLSGSGGVVPRPTAGHHHTHRHSVAATATGAQPPKHLSTQSLTTACWYPSQSSNPPGGTQFSGGGGSGQTHNNNNSGSSSGNNNNISVVANSDIGGSGNNNITSGGGSNGSSYNNNNNQNSANGASSSSYSSATATQHHRSSLSAQQNNLNSNSGGSPRSDTRSNNSFSQNIHNSASAVGGSVNSNTNNSLISGGGGGGAAAVAGAKPNRVNSDRHVYDFNRQLSAPIESRSSSSSVNNIIPSHNNTNNIALGAYHNSGSTGGGASAANNYSHLVGSSYTNSLTRNKKHRSLKLTGR